MSEERSFGKKGGVFLVLVDGTEELMTAIDYASQFAKAQHGYVALLNVIEQSFVQNWKNVEDTIRKETRLQAEQQIWDAAGRVFENTGATPMVCIEEGSQSDIIAKTIDDNKNIVALVLASASNSSNPGPLVSYFSGKGLSRLNVPLMVIPGSLDPLPFP